VVLFVSFLSIADWLCPCTHEHKHVNLTDCNVGNTVQLSLSILLLIQNANT
jgi:hypothetical protein